MNTFKIIQKERVRYPGQNGQYKWHIYYDLEKANGRSEYLYCRDKSPLKNYRVDDLLIIDLQGLHRSANGRIFFDNETLHEVIKNNCYHEAYMEYHRNWQRH